VYKRAAVLGEAEHTRLDRLRRAHGAPGEHRRPRPRPLALEQIGRTSERLASLKAAQRDPADGGLSVLRVGERDTRGCRYSHRYSHSPSLIDGDDRERWRRYLHHGRALRLRERDHGRVALSDQGAGPAFPARLMLDQLVLELHSGAGMKIAFGNWLIIGKGIFGNWLANHLPRNPGLIYILT